MTGHGPLLWVAEDCDEDYEALDRMLRRAGPDTRLERFTRGEQVIAALRAARPHGGWPALLLLDLNLPTMTGLQTLAQIRADERLRMLPVVVLSGSRRQQDIDAAYAAGANAYASKPVDARELDLLLRSLLDWWGRTLLPSRPPLGGAA